MTKFLQPFHISQLQDFHTTLMTWFNVNGRHDLPWKPSPLLSDETNLYHIWLSEIMLQQTQVVTVIPYFLRFIEAFPTVESLAKSDLNEVLKLWEGLGYYARARNLHHAAQQLLEQHNGLIPCSFEAIKSLKGVGRTTAAAILAQGYQRPFAIFDGNVKRVMARILGAQHPEHLLEATLLPFTYLLSLQYKPQDYTQAIMDFGASICKRTPLCDHCFWNSKCITYQENQTNNIPSKKIRKARPKKSTYFLVIKNQNNEILLYHREHETIWNNLYSFPEWQNEVQELIQLLKNEKNIKIQSHFQSMMFKHQFTHFTLEITPIIISVECKKKSLIIGDQLCYFRSMDEMSQLPKSKPSNIILDRLFS